MALVVTQTSIDRFAALSYGIAKGDRQRWSVSHQVKELILLVMMRLDWQFQHGWIHRLLALIWQSEMQMMASLMQTVKGPG